MRWCGIWLLLVLGASAWGADGALKELDFKDLRPGEFGWLLEYAERPATAAMADGRFAGLRDGPLSILKAKFDLGDPVGGSTLVRDEVLSALGGVPDAVEAFQGRYVVLSGCGTAACTDRAFVWVDTARGLVVAMLVFPSSAGLPGTSPEVLLASRQMDAKCVERGQLPERFWEDWRDWAYARKLPAVMTERMVNTYGGASVIIHEEDAFCRYAMTTVAGIECEQKNVAAATADMDALLAQVRTHLDAGKERTEFAEQQARWEAYRESVCRAAAGSSMVGRGRRWRSWGASAR